MIKKITAKLKKIFGQESKKTAVKFEKKQKENKTVPQYSKKNYNKNPKKPARQRRRKETPEEYRARHAKIAEREKQTEAEPEKEIHSKWNPSQFKVPIADGKTRFQDLNLPNEILHAIYDLKFEYCTPVQAETLPKSLIGEDVTAQAQTGTGKTAAFLITIFNHFLKKPIKDKRKNGTPRALILAPTRELVLQIEKDAIGLGKYIDYSILSIIGGINYGKQQNVLKSGPIDILVCTPGRLIDFMQQKLIDLKKVEILIIDEADRMLDMGFIPSVKKIVLSAPQKSKRQTMFFSATISGDVERLAESWTRQAVNIAIKPEQIAVDTVKQITYITTVEEKPALLYNLIRQKNLTRVLIFVNRRHDAKRLRDTLNKYGITCALLTGDVDQKQRIRRLERFRNGQVRVLVATDVASRGIHVDAISHVINYNMPQDSEDYVHRIGRTGRAGASGISINFADEQDSYELYKLEEFLGKKIECIYPEDELLTPIPAEILNKKSVSEQNSGSRNRNRNYNKKKYSGKRRDGSRYKSGGNGNKHRTG